jgi:hypothetical protein
MPALLVALGIVGGIAAGLSSSSAPDTVIVHLIRRCARATECLPVGTVRTMKDETSHIWSSSDVTIVWLDSADHASAAAADVDLKVMLEESAEPGRAWAAQRGLVLAAVHQPETSCGQGLVRLWVTRVRRHLASIRLLGFPLANLPQSLNELVLARALGRALAHEVGHYLLGTGQHRSYGLMRAQFTPQELLEPASDARYGLDRRDREALSACRLSRSLRRPLYTVE